jgi:hypothetical protein
MVAVLDSLCPYLQFLRHGITIVTLPEMMAGEKVQMSAGTRPS